jgi:hypothetical protein
MCRGSDREKGPGKINAEPVTAADRGRITVFHGILASQRPRLLSCVVMRPKMPGVFISHNHQDKTFVRRLGLTWQRMG